MVAQLNILRPLLVTDKYLTEAGQTERLVKTMQAAGSTVAVFSDTVPDPTGVRVTGQRPTGQRPTGPDAPRDRGALPRNLLRR